MEETELWYTTWISLLGCSEIAFESKEVAIQYEDLYPGSIKTCVQALEGCWLLFNRIPFFFCFIQSFPKHPTICLVTSVVLIIGGAASKRGLTLCSHRDECWEGNREARGWRHLPSLQSGTCVDLGYSFPVKAVICPFFCKYLLSLYVGTPLKSGC